MKPNTRSEVRDDFVLGLVVGNSRLHWGLFFGKKLYFTWDSRHLPEDVILQIPQCQTLDELITLTTRFSFPSYSPPIYSPPPIFLASVVPQETQKWLSYSNIQVITLNQIPLKETYPTLGIDRALALLGTGKKYGFPALVIDAGTALTFTGVNENGCLVGGAILPGLGLQLVSLGENTGQLPLLTTEEILNLPPRFALQTKTAILSGVIYTLLAGIQDFIDHWLSLFPHSYIAVTGGDGTLLTDLLIQLSPSLGKRLILDSHLILWGIEEVLSNT
ncbi:pantothenate kinase [Cylindrospermopsis raciborskii]|uniref:pantothenate kinase n=1 Tax=Cylindrospermopsis raciborskii TaxID=77022 RepID=UPI0007789B68|nr:pantothenate kinase [Cylindrospermopsis raciborskii]MCZ2200566.1 pantothenate kinase [Cylindrospermopsis raciborskii PAMP2012]MCZ2206377.1 pantothenate kinase [Cylindrospermopsis raciborskii PAMP2011]